MRSEKINVTVDLDRVRASAEAVRAKTGVRLIAVIKADAYGLGAGPVADALSSVADEFGYFTLSEARRVGRPGLIFGPPDGEAAEYRALKVRPAVANREQAERLAGMPVALNVDSGMQRLGCSAEKLEDLIAFCDVSEAFTHADNPASAARLRAMCEGHSFPIHAAATSLLDCPEAWLDAVRPGLALYRGAVRVSGRLIAVRQTAGPIGYTGFECTHVGVMLGGYSNLVSPAPVIVNGRRQRILEVGMNTCFVSVDPADRVGDEVVLLGDGLTEVELSGCINIRPHEVLCRYTAMGERRYVTGG